MSEEVKIHEVPDVRGDYVMVGDHIAYGAVDGRSGMIRVGKIIEIVSGKVDSYGDAIPTKLRVDVEYSSGWGKPEKPVLIQASFKRFVKVRP